MNGEKIGELKDSVCSSSRCGGVILVDTEDWKKPLCNMHYEERSIECAKALEGISEPLKFMAAVKWLEDLIQQDKHEPVSVNWSYVLPEFLAKLQSARTGNTEVQ